MFVHNLTINLLFMLQVTLQVMIAASASLAGSDQTVTRGKLPLCGRISTPWPLKSSKSSWTLWNWPRAASTQTTSSPLSTGSDSSDQMEPSHRLPTSPFMTSLSGSITTLLETLCLVNHHGHIYTKPLQPLNVWVFFQEYNNNKKYQIRQILYLQSRSPPFFNEILWSLTNSKYRPFLL